MSSHQKVTGGLRVLKKQERKDMSLQIFLRRQQGVVKIEGT